MRCEATKKWIMAAMSTRNSSRNSSLVIFRKPPPAMPNAALRLDKVSAHCLGFGASSVLLAHALLNIFFGKIGCFVENFIADAHLVHVAQEGRGADVLGAAGTR